MSLFKKTCLGIDIGMTSLKVAVVSSWGSKKKLENYASFKLPSHRKAEGLFHKREGRLLAHQAAFILEALLRKANIERADAAVALPSFAGFFTTFELPTMSEEEVPRAVEFEAHNHIPLPMSEVTFDCRVLRKQKMPKGVKLRVLLVAVPNTILQSYERLFAMLDMELIEIKAGIFGLIQSAVPPGMEEEPVCLVDIGWGLTTVSIVERGLLQINRSFDISADNFVETIAKELDKKAIEAEQYIERHGLNPEKKDLFYALLPVLDTIADKIEETCESFDFSKGGKEVENIVLCGGTVSLLGLRDYLEARLAKKVRVATPFEKVSFPPRLQPRLEQLGPSFGMAVGMGLRGLE